MSNCEARFYLQRVETKQIISAYRAVWSKLEDAAKVADEHKEKTSSANCVWQVFDQNGTVHYQTEPKTE